MSSRVTLAYVKESGNIVAVHNGEEDDFLDLLSNDEEFMAEQRMRSATGLGLLIAEVDAASFSPTDYFVVDGELTEQDQIELSTDAKDTQNPNGVPEIAGDGQSTCELIARIRSRDGKVNQKFNGNVTFHTERGRLDARNGIVKAKRGVAKVKLTSIAETVPPFLITATADGCTPATMRMEFY